MIYDLKSPVKSSVSRGTWDNSGIVCHILFTASSLSASGTRT